MTNATLAEIKEKISVQHEGDEKQLEVIFSDSLRLIVEAPAGYGKTTTMISRIAYLFASGGIPNPKRILGLTFSVNAALKVKREVAEKLPVLLGSQNSPVALGEKVYSYLLKNSFDFAQVRGKDLSFNGISLITTFSPSFLLRNPSSKKDAYYDMLKIKNYKENIN